MDSELKQSGTLPEGKERQGREGLEATE